MRVFLLPLLAASLFAGGIPEGFTPIFNGRDTSG